MGPEKHSADNDPYDLQRFVDAQAGVIASVLAELKHGHKRGHWIWFVFPQLRGLGRSANSEFYGISGLGEAAEYLKHPVLGPRLVECTRLAIAVEGASAEDILGEIDAMKFRSSMTLFAKVIPTDAIFAQALDKYFEGEHDPVTLSFLESA